MSSRRSTFLPSLAALGALCCQPVRGGGFGEFLWGPYAPAHYLKQFHPSYVYPEDLHRKVRESQQEDWAGLMKLRNNCA